MTIPALTSVGLLPMGIHEATLDDIRLTFGASTTKRAELSASLFRFVDLVREIGFFSRLYVDGSFTTDTEPPGDVDVVLQLPGSKMKELYVHGRWPELNRDAVKSTYNVDCLIEAAEMGHVGMVAFFCTLKTKDVIARKVTAGHRRGILKVAL